MKLPWVSREAYEERGRELIGQRVALRAAEANCAKLTEIIERIACPPRPATPEQFATAVAKEAAAIREPDPVARVIREQAFLDGRTDYDLAAHLRNYASQLKREGLSPDEIVGKLVAWQSTETEPAYDKVG